DLTRVLGILLDNAIEEAAQLPGGQVEVVLSTAPGKVSYRISNAITEETRRRGVIPGQSTKGPARGKGLVIVAKLLEPYQNVMLSSLLLSDTFVQTLSVEEDARAF
ncbi:MAG TPA: GHKL domain-containing protein, partial [Candidatus Aphodomonas merdavium]|nr:GHKL domain-containing protein [Candidatus Aphodomonas merdavium]